MMKTIRKNKNQEMKFTIAVISALFILIVAQNTWCKEKDVSLDTISKSVAQQSNPWDNTLTAQLDKAKGYRDVVVIHLGINDRENEAEKIRELYSQGIGRPVIVLPSYPRNPKTDIFKASAQYVNKNKYPLHIAEAWEKIIADDHRIVGEIFFSGSGIRANTERPEIISFIKKNPGKVTGNMLFVDTDLTGLTKKDFKAVGINCDQTGKMGTVPFLTKPAQRYVPGGEHLPIIGTALGAVPKAIMAVPAIVDAAKGCPDHSLSRRYDTIIKKLDLPKASYVYTPPAVNSFTSPPSQPLTQSGQTYRLLTPSGQPNLNTYKQTYPSPPSQPLTPSGQTYRLLTPSGQPNLNTYQHLNPSPPSQPFTPSGQNYRLLTPSGQPNLNSYQHLYPPLLPRSYR